MANLTSQDDISSPQGHPISEHRWDIWVDWIRTDVLSGPLSPPAVRIADPLIRPARRLTKV